MEAGFKLQNDIADIAEIREATETRGPQAVPDSTQLTGQGCIG